MRVNISPGRGETCERTSPSRARPAFCLVRRQIAAGAGQTGRLVAPAVVALCQDSARISFDRRRHFQLFTGAWTLDAAARTPFVRAGRAGVAEADGANARLG